MKIVLFLLVMMLALATPHSQATPSAHAAEDYGSAPSATLHPLLNCCSAAEQGCSAGVRGGGAAAFQTKDEILPSTFTDPPPPPPATAPPLFPSEKVPYS